MRNRLIQRLAPDGRQGRPNPVSWQERALLLADPDGLQDGLPAADQVMS